MTPLRIALIALVVAASGLGAQVPAQPAPAGPPDVVRGTVTSDSAGPIAGASVIITRGPDRLVQQTRTDSAGRYSSTFDPGTGDYLVYVALPPWKSARRRVQRQGAERELVADFVLALDVATLAAVEVRENRPVRATNTVNPTALEAGSNERWADGVQGQLPPSVAGDLNGLAGTMSGVTMGPNGPSILGAGAESNLTTLNGMGLSASQIPRAARTETRVTGATFDVTRGGFAGANIDVRLGPGSRSYQRRNAFLTLEPSQLQFTDRAGRALGTRSDNLRGSFGADGELIRRALTYNVAVDVSRTASDAITLFDADREALVQAGVAPDSVARLALVSGPIGLPATPFGDDRQRTSLSWLGRLDDTRDTLGTRALTSYVGITRDAAVGFGPLTSRSAGGERDERTYGAQLTLGTYTGPGRRILTETRLAASRVTDATMPFAQLPGATVLVRSADGASAIGTGLSGLSVAGAPYLATNESRWTLEGANETVWNMGGRRHRFKALVSGRADGLAQESRNNALGTFTFNSIADLAAGTPSSFTRTLEQPAREGTVWNAAGALAHQWLPSRWFNMIWGARVEGSGFAGAPARNPALEQALGVRTGAAPTQLHVSPRAGFSFTYNRDRSNGSGRMNNQVGNFYRTTSGVVRGGIGEFRDLLRPGIIADASASTGLAGSTSMLSCVGDAVPAVDWDAFVASPAAIPSRCRDGAGLLEERAPSVMLIGEDYDVPRSWRASLDWSTNLGSWLLKAGALGSYDLRQPGSVDANFGGTPRFVLADEGNRPVFVSPASIDASSGSVSASEARRSSDFGRVAVRTSDLRGYGGQLTVGLAPDPFRFRSGFNLFLGTNYTLQQSRRQYRGFDGAGFGDPREREWAPSAADARHVFVVTGGFSTGRTGTVTLFSRLQSGLPFTPIVQGDVNGDGRGGDRAFVPDYESAANAGSEMGRALRALADGGSGVAAECLSATRGRVVARNGCRGPWTQTLNMQWRPPIPSRWMRRVTANVYLQNVLGGVDQLVNGSDLRGWGSQAQPDPVLLVPRGFDPNANAFRYDVNPRFAETRPARSLVRTPFRLSIDFSVDLSVDYDLQQLRRALEPVRGADRQWTRRGADSITAFYLGNTSSLHKLLMSESDSLFLSTSQYERLRVADSVFSAQVRGVFRPLGEFLAAGGDAPPGKVQLDSVQAAQKAYWKIFWRQPEIADSVLTPAQKELMPTLKSIVAVPQRERENSQWQFGFPVSMLVNPPKPQPRGRF